MLSDRDHRKLLDIQIDSDRDQIRITLAFHDLAGFDRLALQEMNSSRPLAQDQFRTFLLPSFFGSTLLKIAVVASGILNPRPCGAGIDLESDKALSEIHLIQSQRVGSCIEGGVIGRGWNAWLPFLLPGMLQFSDVMKIGVCWLWQIVAAEFAFLCIEPIKYLVSGGYSFFDHPVCYFPFQRFFPFLDWVVEVGHGPGAFFRLVGDAEDFPCAGALLPFYIHAVVV